ncbi:MAG: FAD-dependent oxidoreductase [Oscillatoriales cyanobacterium RM2_1_1]|nr:FAD-dependent oxidoreductase [Oscillatoriales cyanobacterium SM2_3_0]NJO47544.1 FAD-dependent oxidoreductase [Oscillatoriales cyanobacterium RM2_1_1]
MTSHIPEVSQSFWIDSTLESQYPPLTQDISVDVAIVGAGLVGVVVAKLLKQAGKTVAVLEADQVATGVSGHTTAKVTSLHQLIYADLLKNIGQEKARLYGESNQAAIEKLANLVKSEQIDCDFERKNTFSFARFIENLDQVKAEVEAAVQLGLPASFVQEIGLPFEIAGAVKFENQAQFHPRKFILNLAAKIQGEGSFVFEQTRVQKVTGEQPCRVTVANGCTVTAGDVIVATNAPILDQGLFFAKAYAKRSYLIGAWIDPAQDPQGMFIGVGKDYHSIRTAPHQDKTLLLIGGGGHKVGGISNTEEKFEKLAQYAQTYFGVEEVAYRWSTQDLVSFDQLPYIGKLTPMSNHTYVATGFSLWGMSKSIMAAMLLSDLILGIENPWADLYDATRPTPFISKESLKQNLDVGVHWVGDRLKGITESADQIGMGEGKVIMAKGKQIAASRDDQGVLHQVSAVCSHLGCIVAWNNAEKSWDCPCHGARFAPQGQVLHAPATQNLEPI